MRSLNLYDIPDRDLLYIVDEEQGEDGWTDSHSIADRLSINRDHPAQNVGQRFSWLRRYGALEKKDGESKWRLTRAGRALMGGDLDQTQVEMLDEWSPSEVVMLTRYLTSRYNRLGMTASTFMRREWQRGTVKPRKAKVS